MLWHKVQGAGGIKPLSGSYSSAIGSVGRTAGSTSVSVGYPSDIESGDLLFISGYIQGNTIANTLPGWDSSYNIGFNPGFFKTASGAESGSITVSWSGTYAAAISMVRVRLSGFFPSVVGFTAGYGTNISSTPQNTLSNGYDYNILTVGFGVLASDATINSPTPSSLLYRITTAPSLQVWQWDDNTSTVSVTATRDVNWRLYAINAG